MALVPVTPKLTLPKPRAKRHQPSTATLKLLQEGPCRPSRTRRHHAVELVPTPGRLFRQARENPLFGRSERGTKGKARLRRVGPPMVDMCVQGPRIVAVHHAKVSSWHYPLVRKHQDSQTNKGNYHLLSPTCKVVVRKRRSIGVRLKVLKKGHPDLRMSALDKIPTHGNTVGASPLALGKILRGERKGEALASPDTSPLVCGRQLHVKLHASSPEPSSKSEVSSNPFLQATLRFKAKRP